MHGCNMKIEKELLEKALELSPSDKMRLIEVLVESLDKPDKSIEKKWIQEALARLEAHRKGETQGIDEEEVFGKSQ